MFSKFSLCLWIGLGQWRWLIATRSQDGISFFLLSGLFMSLSLSSSCTDCLCLPPARITHVVVFVFLMPELSLSSSCQGCLCLCLWVVLEHFLLPRLHDCICPNPQCPVSLVCKCSKKQTMMKPKHLSYAGYFKSQKKQYNQNLIDKGEFVFKTHICVATKRGIGCKAKKLNVK